MKFSWSKCADVLMISQLLCGAVLWKRDFKSNDRNQRRRVSTSGRPKKVVNIELVSTLNLAHTHNLYHYIKFRLKF